MKKPFFIFFIFLLISAIMVSAHSMFLFGISLDFDNELKSNVIKAAQKFLNATQEPIAFDLDNGLVIAHFEPEQRNFVEVHPLGYEVHGMRNENLKHNGGEKKLTKEKGYEIAEKFFNSLPDKAKAELKYNPDAAEVDNTYYYKWFRRVNGIIVAGDDFWVNVDAVNGNIIAWRLSVFEFPKESIGTVPAISRNVAKKVAELSFNNPTVLNFQPYLIVYLDQLIWVNRLQGQFYPFYVGVSAKDGSIAFNGLIPGEIPDNYSTEDYNLK